MHAFRPKKNVNASKPSEHQPSQGREIVKTFRWKHCLHGKKITWGLIEIVAVVPNKTFRHKKYPVLPTSIG